jgi:Insertion element 4 transposase N-terminal
MTITRTITVAGGVFAPGHLGELTRIVPFELADGVLEETRTRERRLRVLPSRVGLYFVLAMCLFPGTGYRGVWAKLTAALDGWDLASPSVRALRDLMGIWQATAVRDLGVGSPRRRSRGLPCPGPCLPPAWYGMPWLRPAGFRGPW